MSEKPERGGEDPNKLPPHLRQRFIDLIEDALNIQFDEIAQDCFINGVTEWGTFRHMPLDSKLYIKGNGKLIVNGEKVARNEATLWNFAKQLDGFQSQLHVLKELEGEFFNFRHIEEARQLYDEVRATIEMIKESLNVHHENVEDFADNIIVIKFTEDANKVLVKRFDPVTKAWGKKELKDSKYIEDCFLEMNRHLDKEAAKSVSGKLRGVGIDTEGNSMRVITNEGNLKVHQSMPFLAEKHPEIFKPSMSGKVIIHMGIKPMYLVFKVPTEYEKIKFVVPKGVNPDINWEHGVIVERMKPLYYQVPFEFKNILTGGIVSPEDMVFYYSGKDGLSDLVETCQIAKDLEEANTREWIPANRVLGPALKSVGSPKTGVAAQATVLLGIGHPKGALSTHMEQWVFPSLVTKWGKLFIRYNYNDVIVPPKAVQSAITTRYLEAIIKKPHLKPILDSRMQEVVLAYRAFSELVPGSISEGWDTMLPIDLESLLDWFVKNGPAPVIPNPVVHSSDEVATKVMTPQNKIIASIPSRSGIRPLENHAKVENPNILFVPKSAGPVNEPFKTKGGKSKKGKKSTIKTIKFDNLKWETPDRQILKKSPVCFSEELIQKIKSSEEIYAQVEILAGENPTIIHHIIRTIAIHVERLKTKATGILFFDFLGGDVMGGNQQGKYYEAAPLRYGVVAMWKCILGLAEEIRGKEDEQMDVSEIMSFELMRDDLKKELLSLLPEKTDVLREQAKELGYDLDDQSQIEFMLKEWFDLASLAKQHLPSHLDWAKEPQTLMRVFFGKLSNDKDEYDACKSKTYDLASHVIYMHKEGGDLAEAARLITDKIVNPVGLGAAKEVTLIKNSAFSNHNDELDRCYYFQYIQDRIPGISDQDRKPDVRSKVAILFGFLGIVDPEPTHLYNELKRDWSSYTQTYETISSVNRYKRAKTDKERFKKKGRKMQRGASPQDHHFAYACRREVIQRSFADGHINAEEFRCLNQCNILDSDPKLKRYHLLFNSTWASMKTRCEELCALYYGGNWVSKSHYYTLDYVQEFYSSERVQALSPPVNMSSPIEFSESLPVSRVKQLRAQFNVTHE